MRHPAILEISIGPVQGLVRAVPADPRPVGELVPTLIPRGTGCTWCVQLWGDVRSPGVGQGSLVSVDPED